VIDLSLARKTPFSHQLAGVSALVDNPAFALFDEMGAGKTKQVIDAACILYLRDIIDRVIVVAPASVRTGVWYDPELGELKKHLWDSINARVVEYHVKRRHWLWESKAAGSRFLDVWITNYEFLRNDDRLNPLFAYANSRTLLVLDESSAVKHHSAQQTRACMHLRRVCGRIVILNGTPISHNPLDIFSQAALMLPTLKGFGSQIFDAANFFHFRSRYAQITTQPGFPKIIGWQNLEDMQARMKPYVLRRMTRDCVDMPAELPPVTLTVRLTPESWHAYKEMRDELILWLDAQTVAVSAQAATRVMRLAQITAGFVGGLERAEAPADAPEAPAVQAEPPPAWIPRVYPAVRTDRPAASSSVAPSTSPGAVRLLGREKLEAVLDWAEQVWAGEPNAKLIVWCRFRPEVSRLLTEAAKHWDGWAKLSGLRLAALWGGQKREERDAAIKLLMPESAPNAPGLVAGIAGTGAKGLNLTACHHMLFGSNSPVLEHRLQAMKRVDRPGQTQPVWYGDLLAEGPGGQKTIDHAIIKALRSDEDLATWTCSAWRAALLAE
jgi:SNF2 domain-containing protein